MANQLRCVWLPCGDILTDTLTSGSSRNQADEATCSATDVQPLHVASRRWHVCSQAACTHRQQALALQGNNIHSSQAGLCIASGADLVAKDVVCEAAIKGRICPTPASRAPICQKPAQKQQRCEDTVSESMQAQCGLQVDQCTHCEGTTLL